MIEMTSLAKNKCFHEEINLDKFLKKLDFTEIDS